VNAPGVDPKKLPKEEFDLSVTRAKVIYDFLVNNGINANTLSYKGYGNSRMKYPTPQNEAQENENRRVEIKVLKL
jgi:outer membrane protein OmpA-like peptidoglycan-associated protein